MVSTLSRGFAVNDTPSIAAAVGCFAIAVQVFMIMPIYVGALADSYGFDNRQLGWITSSELSGQAIAILLALAWIRQLSWRTMMLSAGLLLVTCNLLSIYADGAFTFLLFLRGLAGFAVGTVLAIGCTLLGDTAQADRNFGLLIGAEVFLQIILFALLPTYVADYGVNVIYFALALLALIVLPLSLLIPEQGSRLDAADTSGLPRFGLPVLGLLGTVIFFAGIMLVWSFIERLGIAWGIEPAEIGEALSISGVISLAGALFAAALADRLGRLLPMLAGAAGILLSYWILATQASYWNFVLAASLLAVFWNFWLPYQMGAVAAVDIAGRYVVLIPFAQSLGVAVGPVIAGQILVDNNFVPLMYFSSLFLIVCLLIFMPLLRTIRTGAVR